MREPHARQMRAVSSRSHKTTAPVDQRTELSRLAELKREVRDKLVGVRDRMASTYHKLTSFVTGGRSDRYRSSLRVIWMYPCPLLFFDPVPKPSLWSRPYRVS